MTPEQKAAHIKAARDNYVESQIAAAVKAETTPIKAKVVKEATDEKPAVVKVEDKAPAKK